MVRIYARDKDAEVYLVGKVTWDAKKKMMQYESFDEEHEGIIIGLEQGMSLGGGVLKGKELYDNLPYVLRGIRLWAVAS